MSMLATPVSRRHLIGGAAGLGALLAFGACGSSGADQDSGGAWTFTDDLGIEVSLDRRPRRIVAYVSSAAALWDFGIRPVGVYGPLTENGKPTLQAGNIDVDTIDFTSNSYTELDLEALVEVEPDLVIAGLNGRTAADRWIIKDDIAQDIEKICPVFSIQEAYAPLPQIIESYGTLAERLGADVDDAAVTSAKQEFDAASADLRDALAAKPDLRTEFTYADTEGFYVASPKFYSTLIHYADLGMDIARQDDPSTEFYEQLSWESVDRYPVDVIFADERTFSLPVDELKARPTFADLPAARADQIGGWNGEPRFSYQQATPEIQQVARTIAAAEVLTT